MIATRVAGLTAVVSGSLLILALVASAVGAAGTFVGASGASGPMRMMGGAYGQSMMAHVGPMRPAMMRTGAHRPGSAPIPNAPEVRVEAANFTFTPSAIDLSKAADVNLTFANPTSVAHDLTVPALGIRIVTNAGETRTIGLRNLAAGRYDAYCSAPGHAALGMRATVIVD